MESMTGFGRGSAQQDGRELMVELKAVNHRFLDISCRTPKSLSFLEDAFRSRLKQSGVERGHIDIYVNDENHSDSAKTVEVDEALLRGFNRALKRAGKLLDGCRRPTVAEVLTVSGALHIQQAEEDRELVTKLALEAADEAIAQLLHMRKTEGDALAKDLLANLDALSRLKEEITARAPQVPEAYRNRLNARMEEWQLTQADPQRLAQEVALMADRCAIDEELSRLNSHIAQFRETTNSAGEAGKKLDFLLQEMNREINTIGSKASDTEITKQVVAAKCIVEKLREQVQNVV